MALNLGGRTDPLEGGKEGGVGGILLLKIDRGWLAVRARAEGATGGSGGRGLN